MPAPRFETLVLALLAQRLQRLENLLRRQTEGSETASSPTPDAEQTPVASAQPPAHWVRHLHPQEPPAHWLELVRQKAPGLLDGTGRGVLQARRQTLLGRVRPQPAVTPPDMSGTPTGATSEKPILPTTDSAGDSNAQHRPTLTFSVTEPHPSRPPVYPAPEKRRPQPLMVYTSIGSQSQRAAEMVQQPEMPLQADNTLLSFGKDSTLAQTAWNEPSRTQSLPAPALTINDAPSSNVPEWISDNAPAISAYVFPQYGELSPLESRPAPKAESPAVPLAPQPAFDESERPAHSQIESRYVQSFEGVWPELPAMDTSSEADEMVFLQNWKHRERLDREQRGVGWSEPLS